MRPTVFCLIQKTLFDYFYDIKNKFIVKCKVHNFLFLVNYMTELNRSKDSLIINRVYIKYIVNKT